MLNNSEKINKLTNDKIVKLGYKIAVTELKSFLSSKGFTRKLFGPYTDKTTFVLENAAEAKADFNKTK